MKQHYSSMNRSCSTILLSLLFALEISSSSSTSLTRKSKVINYDLDIYQRRKEHTCLFVSIYLDKLLQKDGKLFGCTKILSLNTTKFNRGEYFFGQKFIPYEDLSFDIVFLMGPFTNYSYIASAFLTAEVARVTKVDGLILPFFKKYYGSSTANLCTNFASFSSHKGYGLNYWIWRSYFMKYYIVNGLEIRKVVKPTCIFERVKVSIFVNDGHENTKKVDKKVELEAAIEFQKNQPISFNVIEANDKNVDDNSKLLKRKIVVVEPRSNYIQLLIALIENIIKNKPKNWKIQVFVGIDTDVDKLPQVDANNANITYSILPTNDLAKKEYNELFKSLSFWNQIDAEYIQIMQTDSALCKHSRYTLDDFIQFPYIGCSSYIHGWSDLDPRQPSCLGIGGFSMRTKSKMISCIKNNKNDDEMYYGDGEDFFFSRCMIRSQLKIPSESDMRRYCLQHNVIEDNLRHNDTLVPIGIHTAGISRATSIFLSKRCPDGQYALGFWDD